MRNTAGMTRSTRYRACSLPSKIEEYERPAHLFTKLLWLRIAVFASIGNWSQSR
jgi:hypothetical protein